MDCPAPSRGARAPFRRCIPVPPASRPMAEALRAHASFAAGPHRRLVGPFLCPASRLPELDACLAAGVPAPAAGGRRRLRRVLRLEAGLRHPGPRPGRGPGRRRVPLPPGRVRLYVELAPRDDLDRWLDAIAAAGGHRVKVRGTGPSRHAVPSCGWLAEVLVGCAERRLVLKVAGGADHPFRRRGDPGPHHGIVNLLAAAGAARGGAAAHRGRRARRRGARGRRAAARAGGRGSSCPRSPPAPSRPRQVSWRPGGCCDDARRG